MSEYDESLGLLKLKDLLVTELGIVDIEPEGCRVSLRSIGVDIKADYRSYSKTALFYYYNAPLKL